MTTVLTRWLFLFLVSFVVTGCSLPILNLSAAKEVELFAQGLDQYIASGDLTTLKQLPQEFPEGEWRLKAEAIIEMARQQRQLQAQLEKKDKKLALCPDVKDLASCQAERSALVQDNQMLEETLKQLKEVLIDTEKRTE